MARRMRPGTVISVYPICKVNLFVNYTRMGGVVEGKSRAENLVDNSYYGKQLPLAERLT